jgi:hypothetical protein
MKSIKLNTGREAKIKYLSKARTAWIRKGVEGADDNFIKTLSDDEKNELSVAIQDYQRLGE